VTKRRKTGSVQRNFVGIREVRQDVVCLRSSAARSGREYRAYLEITGINLTLMSEQEQLVVTEKYQHLLASLTYPIQVLLRVLPLNLSPYVRYLAPRVSTGAKAAAGTTSGEHDGDETAYRLWRQQADDQIAFLRTLASNRTLLERRFYLIVPADMDLSPKKSWMDLSRKQAQRKTAGAEWDRASAQLELRVGQLARQFSDMGLVARRLTSKEAARFYQSCLMPRKARRFPLPDEVLDGIGLPTGAKVPVGMALSKILQGKASLPPESAQQETGHFLWWHWRKKNPASTPLRGQGDFTQLADVLAPDSVFLRPEALRVEQEYNRVIVVDALPRSVSLGFMAPLVNIDLPMDASWHYRRRDQGNSVNQLVKKRTEHASNKRSADNKGNPQDPKSAVAVGDVEELLPKVTSGEERMLDVSMYILLRGASMQELEESSDKLMQVLHHMLVVARPATYEQDLGLRSCLPDGRDLLGRAMWLPSISCAIGTFAFMSNTLMMDDGIVEGITPTGEPVVISWWSQLQRNANRLIFAPPGSGKSYKCKIDFNRMCIKYLREWDGHGPLPFQAFIIDPEGEWQRPCAAWRGQYIRLGTDSSHHINPFELPGKRERSPIRTGTALDDDERTDVLAEAVRQLHALMEIMLADRTSKGAGTLTNNQKGFIDRCLYETYRNAGITSDPSTHQLRPPTMADLSEVMSSGMCGPDPDGLAQRLRRYVDGSLAGLFAGQTNVKLSSPVVAFYVPKEQELRAIIYFLISRYVWNVSFDSRIPRMLIVDEMLSLYEHPEGASFLETLFQRSRKHYLSLVGIVQQPMKLRESTIPANCNTIILMKQEAASLDLLGEMFKLSAQQKHSLEVCGKGDALLLNNQHRIFAHFEASELEHRMASTDPVELDRWEREASQEGAHAMDVQAGGGHTDARGVVVTSEPTPGEVVRTLNIRPVDTADRLNGHEHADRPREVPHG
jgi:hypothetical protein